VAVCYTEERPGADEGPFLKEERKLINTIADRIGLFLLQRRLRQDHESWQHARDSISSQEPAEWRVILEFLQRTDQRLLRRITRKMINYLCCSGVPQAEGLLQAYSPAALGERLPDDNRPLRREAQKSASNLAHEAFQIAAASIGERETLDRVHRWIEEDKSSDLLDILESPHTDLMGTAEALERHQASGIRVSELPDTVRRSLNVALLRRFFTDDLAFLNIAKDYVTVSDFHDLQRHMVYPSRSHGKLGGKSAGLFLAMSVLRGSGDNEDLAGIRCPKTWYLTSDAVLEFIRYNNLEDLYDRKYMEIEIVRREYPHILQVFKNSIFPPEITKGLAAALDDLEDRPLIVRSSSLLEDQPGAAFSGKYKSLFLANRGTKAERLEALQDAVAEVYASIFGPDPIEYRAERGLLDVHEEMGIMIQEVVGRRLGRYFLPAYAGVAYSNNEFRWSPRIKREDGLIRMVPGLGTRAVDRLTDDFPVLAAPGQPGLRVNTTADEIVRYSPRMADLINLETNEFETVEVRELLKECGEDYPLVRQIVSMAEPERVRSLSPLEPDWEHDELVVTFDGVLREGRAAARIQALLGLLREKLNTPVDLEFACDGDHFYLLQCRAQSYGADQAAPAIPRDISRDKIVFTADRHISNGWVANITHLVYVDAESYSKLSDLKRLKDVGRALGRLNKLLPKRQFILIGPGRWGSRGDIKLGVSVTYSDINNTAVLCEMAHRKGSYLPELSFGTHFFQDLVEADIRYIPLYPDEPENFFNEAMVRHAPNILPDLLPEYAELADTLKVIDVGRVREGHVVHVLMNAELDEAVALLTDSERRPGQVASFGRELEAPSGEHWRWRLRMAERIAELMPHERFGVKQCYVFGSAKNATAGPSSDLDLLIHFSGSDLQREQLLLWLDGWSRSLAEVNYLRTGYSMEGMLDVHLVTDEDIERRTSYASKIGAVTDAARPLAGGGAGERP
jgi:hypothetical protein